MRSALCLLGIACATACSEAPVEAPAQPPAPPASVAPASRGEVTITVDDGREADPRSTDRRIRVNGAAVATVASILEAHRVQPVDGALSPLKAALDAARPGDDLVVVRAPPETPVLVVKSLAISAALVGYGRLAFERTGDRVTIQIPKPSAPPMVERRLVVRLLPKQGVVLAWRESELLSTVDLPWTAAFEGTGAAVRAPAVAAKIAQQWPEQGVHRDPADRGTDRAIVEVEDDVDLGHVLAVVEAIAATTRDKQGARVPAFAISIAPGITAEGRPAVQRGPGRVTFGAIEARGAGYAPEIVGHVLRQRYQAIGACYAAGLARAPKLAGRPTLTFTIGKAGDVSKLSVAAPLADKVAQQCVLEQVKTLSFPGPDAPVTIKLPITFEPRDAAP